MSDMSNGAMKLPAICSELRLRSDSGTAVVNSRDVAEFFEKQHFHVLRDIDALISDAPGAASNFGGSEYRDGTGRVHRCFDMTRDGFTLLVMGWTGERALQFKVRYIEAFNAMEAALKAGAPVTSTDLMMAIREIVAPLAVRFDHTDTAITEMKTEIQKIPSLVADEVRRQLPGQRKQLTKSTKADHIDAVWRMGGVCPCCGTSHLFDDDKLNRFSEFDHFYQNSAPSADHTWLICKPCHSDLTYGRVVRDARAAEFQAYQQKRRRLPGRQVHLF